MAMALFLPSGSKLSELYECRGTSFIENREQVKVNKLLVRALVQSRYGLLKSFKETGANCKKCDRQMNFIVRVMRSCSFKFMLYSKVIIKEDINSMSTQFNPR